MKSDISPDLDMDLMVCSFPPMMPRRKADRNWGQYPESRHIEDFDDTTVIGAMETIIAYTQGDLGMPGGILYRYKI